MRPPFSFWSCPKRERAAPGVREKGALAATLHMRAKLLYGGRRIGACSDLALPSGTLGPSARSILPSRGGWCGGHRGARTHLTSSSFRAFRFATRCPGGRRSRCSSSPLLKPSSTTGQRQRKEKQLNAMTTPTPSAPSTTGRQYRPRRRRERARRQSKIGACTDTPTLVQRGGTKVPERA